MAQAGYENASFDPTVPVSQARAFHQGCLHCGVPCEFVVYRREGHSIFPPYERAYYIDALERMERFCDKHIGVADSR
jgi:dipeptidyl aminopeptidase/acylaminoacyl peptidase